MKDTNYYMPTIEEANEFTTWHATTHIIDDNQVIQFEKLCVPDWLSVPSENFETIKKQRTWFDRSNREDKIVLERERYAFDEYYSSTMLDIEKHL
jgi:hypothetical protein